MPRIALSFDDGPGPATARLLDVLAARNAKATFFLLGSNIERAREVVLRIAREGHVLGNHTYSHGRPGELSAAQVVDEVTRTDELLREVAAEAGSALLAPIPVRLPYGPAANDPRLPALASIGRTHVHWTGDFGDWLDPDPNDLVDRMRAHVQAQHAEGLAAVLDLHDSSRVYADRAATVEGVRLLLEDTSLEVFTVPSR